MAKDYYELLGVSKSASADEIKKSYRKAALKYHPDRNPDDAAAESNFKEVSQAYEVLGDTEKRQMYDRVGHDAYVNRSSSGGGGGYSDPFDLFSSVFGGGGGGGGGSIFEEFFGGGGGGRRQRQGGPRQGADLRYDLVIAFEEAVFGIEKEEEITKPSPCGKCTGSGVEPGSSKLHCGRCNGSGQVTVSQGFFSLRQTCQTCGGTGEIVEQKCRKCSGGGQVNKTKKIRVKIPPGVDTGARLRYSREGVPGTGGGPPGDLYIVLHVEEHEIFKRDGDDVVLEMPIDYATLALGGKVEVPTISGTEELNIPAGTANGKVITMSGKGIPSRRRKGRGDQHVVLSIEIPRKLNRAQREALETFHDSCESKTHPVHEKFMKRLKDLFP
ncbi:MAG: molecular chaperone DnaJ [Lentisphaeria bacterium]|jgi:molecular chaperone DnaJ|nr:molecular chaperone DnaJ [Lentisphaeria bacterium]MDP7741811.1 molecular chaperone DnaJ [Lentisphaeria bacterium]